MDEDFFKASLKHDSHYIKSIWGFGVFFTFISVPEAKNNFAIEGEWESKRLNQPTTEDYHNKMIYDSKKCLWWDKTFFFLLNLIISYTYSEES